MAIKDVIRLKAPPMPKGLDDDKIKKAVKSVEQTLAELAKALSDAKDEWYKAEAAVQKGIETTFEKASDRRAPADEVKAAQELHEAMQKVMETLYKL